MADSTDWLDGVAGNFPIHKAVVEGKLFLLIHFLFTHFFFLSFFGKKKIMSIVYSLT